MPTTPKPSPADEDLSQMERDIRQLKIEYEQFFGGGRSRPPADVEWRIDQLIKRYTEKGTRLNSAQRFRFNGLCQTHAKFREVFRKRAKQREEATVTRHFGAAAREIEQQRRSRAGRERQGAAIASRAYFTGNGDPARDFAKTKKLYEAFRKAKERAGESTQRLSLASFQDFLSRKTRELRGGSGNIEFAVETEGDHVRLKARVRD